MSQCFIEIIDLFLTKINRKDFFEYKSASDVIVLEHKFPCKTMLIVDLVSTSSVSLNTTKWCSGLFVLFTWENHHQSKKETYFEKRFSGIDEESNEFITFVGICYGNKTTENRLSWRLFSLSTHFSPPPSFHSFVWIHFQTTWFITTKNKTSHMLLFKQHHFRIDYLCIIMSMKTNRYFSQLVITVWLRDFFFRCR